MFNEVYNKYKTKADLYLQENFANGGFPKLKDAMKYSLFAGGKRLRPVIFLYLADIYNIDEMTSSKFASALEMIHTYSLIHDDLPCMDNDVIRRGKPTNHVVFGDDFALLAGDALLNLAYETLFSAIVDKNTLNAAKVIASNSGIYGMCSGQGADLFFEKKNATIKDVEYINNLKTGALLKCAFVSPLIIAGATDYEISIMAKIGLNVGVLFQLTDDLLDKYGEEKKLGKSIGKDEKESKINYLSLLGKDATKDKIQSLSKELLCDIDKMNKNLAFIKELVDFIVNREC